MDYRSVINTLGALACQPTFIDTNDGSRRQKLNIVLKIASIPPSVVPAGKQVSIMRCADVDLIQMHGPEHLPQSRFQADIRCAKALDRRFGEAHYRTCSPYPDH
jgi:hypothetical protein